MRPSWRPFPPPPQPPRFPGSQLNMRPRGPPDYHQPCPLVPPPPPLPLSGLPMPINNWPGYYGPSRYEPHAAGRWPPPPPSMMTPPGCPMANWNDPNRFQGAHQVMLPPPPPPPYRASFHHDPHPPIMERFRPPMESRFSGQQPSPVTRFHPPPPPLVQSTSSASSSSASASSWPNSKCDEQQYVGDRHLNEGVRDQHGILGSRPAKRTASSQVDRHRRRSSRSPNSERRGGDYRSDNRHRSSKSDHHRKDRSESSSRQRSSSSSSSSSRSDQRHRRITSPSVIRRPIRSSRDASSSSSSSRRMISAIVGDAASSSSSHEKGEPYMYYSKQAPPPPPSLLRPSGYKLPMNNVVISDNDHRSSTREDSCRGAPSHRSSSQRPDPAVAAAQTCYDEEKFLQDELKEETSMWSRCSPSDLHYRRSTDQNGTAVMVATSKLTALLDRFEEEILMRVETDRSTIPVKCDPPNRRLKFAPLNSHESSDSNSDSYPSSDDDNAIHELERKRKHPNRLHEELWYNDVGEMNDGPLCRCSYKAKRSGIRHGLYPGEDFLKECEPHSNNADRLFHYRITMSPHTNFLTKAPTIIEYDGHEFLFEGFSMLSHYKLPALPLCKVIRFNIEYTIHYMEEKLPENFTVRGVDLFCDYLYRDILELIDLELRVHTTPAGCRRFHFFPRFARALEENGKEVLSMNEVLIYLLNNAKPLVEEDDLARLMELNQYEWQNFADQIKGMIVTYPGKKPCSLRVDQLDRDVTAVGANVYPEIVHFGIRPLQLSYAGNPNYQKAWREYVKFRHLLANKPKVCYQDRHKLMQKEIRLQDMRTKSNLKRDVTIVVSSKGFYRTGIMCDVVQHAMLLPVLVCHLRFHKSLDILEGNIGHSFQDRYLLQLALTHPSYRENFGTNPDHARNSLTNCGIRQPEYGDRRIHYMNTRKRGINTLINIMSRFGKHVETLSNINHNERLEFLGDAVVEFLTSIHLFHLFPDIEEGGLATYRAAIVQNQHLAVLAKKLELEKFMLYAHGSDLCHDLELRHAMANCFEALMGALFLDGGVQAADRVFSQTLFSEEELLNVWINYPPHPIQEQEPDGDRQWIESVPLLRKMTKFEEEIGVTFKHIRLLARAFTHRSVGYNHLTLGSNQRLEFLGDTVLQLVASEYLYKFFPEHHEGHLSLLRSSLVNNRTQSVVCNDLGMVNYAIYAYPKGELKIKDRADLLEAFLGALYVDQGLTFCQVFCQVCFFPRLQDFIMNQDWNDPKSKLQQCCLTLRTMDGGEPDIPIYKVIESKGPTNTRIFTVAVYFRGKRLAKGSGHSIQQAEMAAASKALESSKADLFPQLNHQRRVIERSLKQYRQSQREKLRSGRSSNRPSTSNDSTKQLDVLSDW